VSRHTRRYISRPQVHLMATRLGGYALTLTHESPITSETLRAIDHTSDTSVSTFLSATFDMR
jgi:hypothetical protein